MRGWLTYILGSITASSFGSRLELNNSSDNICERPQVSYPNHTIYDVDISNQQTLKLDRPVNTTLEEYTTTNNETNIDFSNLESELETVQQFDLTPTPSKAPKLPPIPTSPLKDRFNHASADCAAVILQSTPSSSGASSILTEKKDKYMLTPCNSNKRWIVTELCNEIRIDTVILANYEFFSGAFKKFRVSVSRSWPVSEEGWLNVGEFRAKNVRGIQTFQLERPTPDFYRYLRIDFLDHYGNEYYCPLSLLRVYGVDQMEAFRLEEAQAEEEEEQYRSQSVEIDTKFDQSGLLSDDIDKFLDQSTSSSFISNEITENPEEIEAFETTLYEDLFSPAYPPPSKMGSRLNDSDYVPLDNFEIPTRTSSQQPQRTIAQSSPINSGESIYRTINKRLASLESQSQMLTKALKNSRISQRSLSGKFEALALRNEVRLAETMKSIERSHREVLDERDRLKSEVSYLTNEAIVGKRLGIAQIVILLVIVCIGIITRGSATTIRPSLKRKFIRNEVPTTPLQKTTSMPNDDYPPSTRSRAASISGLKLSVNDDENDEQFQQNSQLTTPLPAYVHQRN